VSVAARRAATGSAQDATNRLHLDAFFAAFGPE
jgi:hypothetical protein